MADLAQWHGACLGRGPGPAARSRGHPGTRIPHQGRHVALNFWLVFAYSGHGASGRAVRAHDVLPRLWTPMFGTRPALGSLFGSLYY